MSFVISALLLTTNAKAADYDLVINNGRVMDPAIILICNNVESYLDMTLSAATRVPGVLITS